MLADCIRLAQTNNEALEALLQKFAPLIKKCGRQLHIEDGNEEMILAFIELVKDFSPSNLRNIDDGTPAQPQPCLTAGSCNGGSSERSSEG